MDRAPKRRPHIVATRHTSNPFGEIKVERVLLAAPPVAVVSPIESVVGGWWRRAHSSRNT